MIRTSLGLACLLLAGAAHADWVISPNLEAVRPRPDNNQVQPQNPPSFAWARHSSNPPTYALQVWRGTELAYSYTTSRNWYLPTTTYPAGHYTWRVRPSTSTTAWSDMRGFDITSASMPFIVPDNATLKKNVMANTRPRELPPNFKPASQWDAGMQAERSKALKALSEEITGKIISLAPLKDSDWPLPPSTTLSAALNTQNADIRQRVNTAGRQLEASALLWRLTGDRKFLTEALTRGDQLRALNPYGPTSYANQDQGTRVISLSLIKAIDMLAADLDGPRRNAWLGVIKIRTNDIYKDLSGSNGRLDEFPYDSHGGTNLGFLSLISVLSLGDIGDADMWFDFAVRAYINTIYAWSGPEGGYANGTAYAQYTADYALQIWQPLIETIGLNLFDKPWSNGFLQYFAQFVPPGATNHVFGDEHETIPDFRMMKAYASRFHSGMGAWYAQNIAGDEDALSLLQAQYPLPYKGMTPVAPPNAGMYPSIGWVAMHSNIADRNRTSVYFKSSPYGAYNHSHGDQNGILVSSGGRPLLIEAGYLDYYGSPLFNDWYRQTKAHNAITYDGGIGQLIGGNTANLGHNGKVTAFSTSATFDYTEGDATPAYGAVAKSAIRRLWYLRGQDAVVVQDKILGTANHVWEWNVHAPGSIVTDGNGIKITNVDRTLCIRPIIPNVPYPLTYAVRSGPAPKPGKVEAHGAFVSPSAPNADFLILLDVGCKRPAVQVSDTANAHTITIGGQAISVPK